MTEKIILLYGLGHPRKIYKEKLKKGNDHLTSIDPYVEEITRILLNEQKKRSWWNQLLGFLKLKKREQSCWDSEENLIKFSKEWLTYVDENKKHWLLWKDFYSCTQENTKNDLNTIYRYRISGDDKREKTFSGYCQHVMRGCKVGFDIAKKNPNVELHFCLDGIDFEEVVSKNIDHDGDSITSRELRYACRNWDELKDKVVFIENGKKVSAPWESDPQLWEIYEPKRQRMIDLQSQKTNENIGPEVKPKKSLDYVLNN